MARNVVARLRSFNRTVTRTFGLLEDNYLGRSRSLPESRLIFEIGAHGSSVRTLRSRLGLDPGYLSRLLRSLEGQGLARTREDPNDRRVQIATLTARGLKELEALDQLSNDLAVCIVDPLSDAQRLRLVSAIEEAEQLLIAASAHIEEVSPWHPDAAFCLDHYYVELRSRFEKGFEPEYQSAPALGDFAPPQGSFLLIRQQGEPIGCGALKRLDGDRAYLKRMWISDEYRGLGLGRRLVGALEERAGALGYRFVCLETNAALTEARQLYRNLGYRKVPAFNDDPYADYWFEKAI